MSAKDSFKEASVYSQAIAVRSCPVLCCKCVLLTPTRGILRDRRIRIYQRYLLREISTRDLSEEVTAFYTPHISDQATFLAHFQTQAPEKGHQDGKKTLLQPQSLHKILAFVLLWCLPLKPLLKP